MCPTATAAVAMMTRAVRNVNEAQQLFRVLDNDGEIDMSEFVAVMCPSASTVVARISKGYKTLADVKAAFKKLDRDGDGNISKSEMAAAGLNEQEVNAIFALGDANNDGQIDM